MAPRPDHPKIDALDNAARLQVTSAEFYAAARRQVAIGRPVLAGMLQIEAARRAWAARYYLFEALEPVEVETAHIAVASAVLATSVLEAAE